eukprot:c21794_g2_i1 orf=80-1462(+)
MHGGYGVLTHLTCIPISPNAIVPICLLSLPLRFPHSPISSLSRFAIAHMATSPSVLPRKAGSSDVPLPSERESGESLRSAGLRVGGSPSAASGLLENAASLHLHGEDPEHGFRRAEMYKLPLVGSVQQYERHVFLCYKQPASWPPQVEASEFDRLPRFLAAAIKARKNDMPKKTRLTICEGRDGTDSSNGDVLIFPDMVRYKGLTHFDVDAFVDEFLVHNREWLSGRPEKLRGAHVFVCCHASRDARCGVCGPALVGKFKEHVSARGLEDQVFVSPCSHVGGHKYAGNVIIYSTSLANEVVGHWYGYVTPEDVPILLDEHINKGKLIDRLWRGQMGLTEDEQKQAQLSRLQPSSVEENGMEGCPCSKVQECANGFANEVAASKCCQETGEDEKQCASSGGKKMGENLVRSSWYGNKFGSTWCRFSSFLEAWEKEDTLAALTVIGAAAVLAVACHMYRNSL